MGTAQAPPKERHFGSSNSFGSTLSRTLYSVNSCDRNGSPSRLLTILVAFLIPP